MSTEHPTPSTTCANCGNHVEALYCSHCGQENVNYNESLRQLIPEVLHEYLGWDSSIFASIPALLFKPGFLTNEFNAGRRMRYISPLRMYLITSFLFFFLTFTFNLDSPKSGKQWIIKGDHLESVDPDSAKAMVQHARNVIDSAEAEKHRRSATISLSDSVNVNVPGLTDSAGSGKKQFLLQGGPFRDSTGKYTMLGNLVSDRMTKFTQNPEEWKRSFASNFPTAMLLLMPVLALLFKLLYIRQPRFYIEHLIMSFHLHAFAYVLLLFGRILENLFVSASIVIALVTVVALIVYIFLAMKRVYKQGTMKTLAKFFLAAAGYTFILAIFSLLTMVATFLI